MKRCWASAQSHQSGATAVAESRASTSSIAPAEGTASLKHVVRADGERSCLQILQAIQQTRARLNLKTEIRIADRDQRQSNGAAERAVQSVNKWATAFVSSARKASTLHRRRDARRMAPQPLQSFAACPRRRRFGRQYRRSDCAFGESVPKKLRVHAGRRSPKERCLSRHSSAGEGAARSLTPSGAAQEQQTTPGSSTASTFVSERRKGVLKKRREAIPATDATEKETMGVTKQSDTAIGFVAPMIEEDSPHLARQ